MQAQLVSQVSFLLVLASHAHTHSACDSSDVCIYYKQCKFYQETAKLIKLESDKVKRIDFVKELRSRVCHGESRFVCCPVDEQRQLKLKPIENPAYLPTQGECGKVEEKPRALVSVLSMIENNNTGISDIWWG